VVQNVFAAVRHLTVCFSILDCQLINPSKN
jgi:hypothetical protein